jgi:hypothetical protein
VPTLGDLKLTWSTMQPGEHTPHTSRAMAMTCACVARRWNTAWRLAGDVTLRSTPGATAGSPLRPLPTA